MTDNEKDELETFFENLEKLNEKQAQEMVEKHLDDEAVEIFVDHIENFYGIEDDEELGHLAQLMITGFIAAKELKS